MDLYPAELRRILSSENRVDPDHWMMKPADQDPHCFLLGLKNMCLQLAD